MQVGNIRPSEICEYPKKVGFLVHQHEIGGLFCSEIREKGVFVFLGMQVVPTFGLSWGDWRRSSAVNST